MIGREYHNVFPPKPQPSRRARAPVLEARNLSWAPRLNDVSLTRPAGRNRRPRRPRRPGPARAAAGAVRRAARRQRRGPDRRQAGRASTRRAPPRPTRIGMALIPEDRKTEGLMLPMSVRDNLSLRRAVAASRTAASSTARPKRGAIDDMIKLLAIKTDGTARAGRLAVGRQPAEGGDRQVADAQARASSCSTTRPAASMSAPSRRSTSCCAGSPTRARRSSSTRPTTTS